MTNKAAHAASLHADCRVGLSGANPFVKCPYCSKQATFSHVGKLLACIV